MKLHHIICLLPLFLSGCEVTEPDRVFNNEPGKPKTAIMHITGIDSTRHYAGTVNIEFVMDSLDFPVRRVECSLDNAFLTSWATPPYRLTLDTRRYTEGAHTLVLAFFGNKQGLLSVRGYASLLRFIPVHFDQTPPEPVNIVSLVWNGSHPTVTWNKSHSPNFFCYILENKVDPYVIERDTFYSAGDTSFTDNSVTKAIGVKTAVYSIKVSNRMDVASGNTDSLGFGEQIPIYADSYSGRRRLLVPSRLRPEVYYYDVATSTFKVVSTLTHTTLHSISIAAVQDMQLHEQEDSLFILTTSAYSLYKFSPLTRALDSITNSQGAFINSTFVLGRPNRGYFSGYGLRTVQLSPLRQLSYMFHEGQFFPRFIEITPDKNTLYFVFDYDYTLNTLDIRADTPQVVSQRAISVPVGMALSPATNEVLLASGTGVDVLQAGTLQLSRTLRFSEAAEYTVFLTHLEATDEYAYVSYGVLRNAGPFSHYTFGKIVKIRKSDWSVQRTWLFNPPVLSFVVLPDETEIYASTYDGRGWIVDME